MRSFQRTSRGLAPLVLVLAVAVLGLHSQPEDSTRLGPTELVKGVTTGSFTISGQVDGLYPGAQQTLPLSLHNANAYAITVTSITVAVAASDHAGCGAAHVVPGPFAGPTVVPAGGTAVAQIPVSMATSPPDVCQGATFPLTYTGLGQRTPLPTAIRTSPVVVGKAKPPLPTTVRFTARLVVDTTSDPVPGKTLTFAIGGTTVCAANTASDGWATCSGVLPSAPPLSTMSYSVTFSGDTTHGPSTRTAPVKP